MKVVDSSFRWNDNCTHEILRPDISGLRMTVVCTLLTMTLTYKSMQEKTLETAKKKLTHLRLQIYRGTGAPGLSARYYLGLGQENLLLRPQNKCFVYFNRKIVEIRPNFSIIAMWMTDSCCIVEP